MVHSCVVCVFPARNAQKMHFYHDATLFTYIAEYVKKFKAPCQ